jgi:hypothetical protein
MMGSQMNINEQKMQGIYERIMDQVYLMYHTHPSQLPHVNLSAAELLEYAESGRIPQRILGAAASAAAQAENHGKVTQHQHLNTSNGMRRR